jgi:hypothetical protein
VLGEKTAGPFVEITLRVSPNQQTTCEIVVRDYKHRKKPLHTRTRYCHSNVHRGRWEQRGPAQHLPRWAILTGSARVVRMEVDLDALTPAAKPIRHATIYLSSNLPHERTPAKVITNAQGRAELLVPYGPFRVLTAAYRGGGGYEAASTKAEVQFEANSSYLASTRYIAAKQPVTFHGALRGGPLPKGPAAAAKIIVQYKLHNRWVTWGTTHTHLAKWQITLALDLSPRSLTTRAVVVPSAKYRYLKGTSRIVHLYITRPRPG